MIIVKSRPDPFEVMFLIASIIGGLGILISVPRLSSTSALQSIPQWSTYMLAIGLIVGATTSISGFFTEKLWGILLERAGLVFLCILFIVYSGSIISFSGLRATTSLTFFLAFSVSCMWRIIHINRSLNEARESIEKARHET